MRSKTGLKVTYEARHEDGKGRLICVDKTRKFKLWFKLWRGYDTWRIAYLNKAHHEHRDNWRLPVSFREGRINPYTLIVAIILEIQEVINGSNSKSN